MSTLKDRIAKVMQEQNLSMAAIARAARVSSSAASQWASGAVKTLKADTAAHLEAATGYRAAWWSTGQPPARAASPEMGGEAVVAFDEDGELPDGMVLIPQSKVRFSAGDGQFFIEDDVQDDAPPAAYRLSWFSGQGMNPSRVRRFEVKGNSMSPTLFDGDRALVDMGETEIIDGRVYAIRYGDELKMKRVYKRLDGGLILHSDNPDHRPQDEELPAALVQEQIAVIGRVRERAGHGGL